jgi:hypothetical protein
LVATPYDPLCLENIQGLQAPLEYHSIEPSLLTSVSNRAVGEGFLSTVQLDLYGEQDKNLQTSQLVTRIVEITTREAPTHEL